MILLILLTILSPVLIILIVQISKEFLAYHNLNFYRKQGVTTVYNPVFGSLFITKSSLKRSKHPLKLQEEFYKKHRKTPFGIVAMNSHDTVQPTLLLVTEKSFADFTTKEVKYFKRVRPLDVNTKEGFFFKHGQEGLDGRAIFAEFFSVPNVDKMLPLMQEILFKHFKKLLKPWEEKKLGFDEYKSVDFVPSLNEAFVDIVTIIIGGVKNPDDMPKLDGEKFAIAIEEFFLDMINSGRNPLNLLTLGLVHKFGLLESSRRGKRRINKVKEYVWNMIEERRKDLESSGKSGNFSGRGVNMVDLMVEFNKKMEDEGRFGEVLQRDEMVEAVVTFYLAGSDTSRSGSTSFLYLLSKMENVQNKIYKEIFEIFFEGEKKFFESEKARNGIDFNKGVIMDKFVKEALRLHGPSGGIFTRKAMANLKMSGIKIKKGTHVTTGIYGVHYLEENFKNPKKFDMERFSDERKNEIKRGTYKPFSLGPRACIGQYFGETAIKSVITVVLSLFELKFDEKFDPFWVGSFNVEMDKSLALIRPRRV